MADPVHCIERTQFVPLPVGEVFGFFADAFNLEAITPPWLHFRILTQRPVVMREGTLIDYRLSLHRVPWRWRSRIDAWEPGRRFVDTQVRGPFRLWEHLHTFEERPGGTQIGDLVRYRMPYRQLGACAHSALIGRDLERIFDYRSEVVGRLLVARSTGLKRA